MAARVEHVFVLMLENRSFDHLFGFSNLSGMDAATGGHRVICGLTGGESNDSYAVTRGADYAMPVDPGHEFSDVLDQLCGPGTRYAVPYPPINNSGFVDSYNHSGGTANPGEVMKCFDTARQLPILYTLAQEYALCDWWFSSLPGPTYPNRMFVHAASSGGLDHSPTNGEVVSWETIDGFEFANGTIFQALAAKGRTYALYSGDEFPMVASLKGVTLADVRRVDALVSDLKTKAAGFAYDYVFIEPSYNLLYDYRNSSSMHPLADVRDGEALVKTGYEAIRSSAVWETSLLLILWDEHGGFYDHVSPPPAVAPGDTAPNSSYNQFGFTFEQYGVRTPAIVVSPYVPRNTIDHRLYDHASVPKTLEELFNITPLTKRDENARSVLSLLSLDTPRNDCQTLPPVAAAPALTTAAVPRPMDALRGSPVQAFRASDSINRGLLPAIVQSALHQQLQLARYKDPATRAQLLRRVAGLRTRGEAMEYLRDAQADLRQP
jgi:phospholipase C